MRGNKRKRRRIVPLLLLLCLLLCTDSAFRPVTTEYDLSFSNLPEGFEGWRVLQLSDVHGAVYGKDNGRLLRKAWEANPDVIVITGDLVNKRTDLSDIETLLRGLTALAPVYYVTGNHEWGSGLLESLDVLFQRYGVCRLKNEYLFLERNGDRIVLAGAEDPNGRRDMERPDALSARIRRDCPEDFILMLAHRNSWPREYPDLPIDLVLCGHAHGGVIRLPGLGGVLGPSRTFFPGYDSGVYQAETYRMLVSRGLGNSNFIPRFLNNPELVLVTLHRGGA